MSLANTQLIIDAMQMAESSVDKTCANCRFWGKEGMNNGYCHRFPPTWNGERDEFPISLSTTWCGEFKTSGEALSAKQAELAKTHADDYPWKLMKK